jgi:hypothetical protein
VAPSQREAQRRNGQPAKLAQSLVPKSLPNRASVLQKLPGDSLSALFSSLHRPGLYPVENF